MRSPRISAICAAAMAGHRHRNPTARTPGDDDDDPRGPLISEALPERRTLSANASRGPGTVARRPITSVPVITESALAVAHAATSRCRYGLTYTSRQAPGISRAVHPPAMAARRRKGRADPPRYRPLPLGTGVRTSLAPTCRRPVRPWPSPSAAPIPAGRAGTTLRGSWLNVRPGAGRAFTSIFGFGVTERTVAAGPSHELHSRPRSRRRRGCGVCAGGRGVCGDQGRLGPRPPRQGPSGPCMARGVILAQGSAWNPSTQKAKSSSTVVTT